MIKKIFILITLIALGAIFWTFAKNYTSPDKLNSLSTHYTNNEIEEVGAANIVTAIVVTYRGFDTLGEVTILFLSAAIVAFFLKVSQSQTAERKLTPVSEILQTASKVLTPAIFLLGIYVFINGHLTPGGGFQGGSIIASGLVLMLMAKPNMKANQKLIHFVESISGFAYVIIGVLGIFYAAGFLDNKVLGLGTLGNLFSAGVIPLIYIFVGLKVGAELSNIVSHLQETQNEI